MRYGILHWWMSALMFGVRLYEGEGGGGGDKSFTQSDIDTAVSKATEGLDEKIDAAVSGLKIKNTDLLGEQTKLKDRLKAFGDLTPEKLQEMITKLDSDDDTKLLQEGKIDELVAKRVDKITAEFEEKLGVVTGERDTANEGKTTAEKRYNNRVVSQEIMKAAITAGVVKEAIDDVLAAARDIFTVGDDDEIEARDKEGNLRKIGDKLLTPEHWLDSLKESKPHYWPGSEGAGAQGNQGDKGSGKGGDISVQLAAAATSGDMKEYRRLRELDAENKKKKKA